MGVGGAIVMIPLLYYVPPLVAVGSLDIKLVAGATRGLIGAVGSRYVSGRVLTGARAALIAPVTIRVWAEVLWR